MSLYGSFVTMSLPDLLQWLGNAGKTGTLEVERNKVVTHIVFRDGCVIACSSDERTQLLGNYLVARGRISEDTLRKALTVQESSRRHLGEILVDMGAVGREELAAHLAEKAEETIFNLFDWDDAAFRFNASVLPTHSIFPVNLRVDEILLRGAQRFDEMRHIRAAFPDPGVVLAHTGKPASEEMLKNRMARRVFELVSGDRSIAEILLHARSSEYVVYKLLFEMFRAGLLRVESVVRVEEELELPEDDLLPAPPVAAPPRDRTAAAVAEPAVRTAAPASPPVPAPAAPVDTEADLVTARKLLDRGEFDLAMDVLDGLYRAHPNHDSLRRLLAEAEAAFVDKAYKHYLPASKAPYLVRPLEELTTEEISPAESFLLTRMDGSWDIKSIIQVSPLREVDALRALKRMRERGIIEFRDPA
jgi:hypothetical protein